VIAVPAVRLAPDEAARRAAAHPGAFWLSAPAPDEVGVARDVVGAAPVAVVRGSGPADLSRVEEAWRAARAAWSASGAPPPAGVPAAVGWFSYDLGRAFVGLAPRAATAEGAPPWPAAEVHIHDAVWIRDAAGAATIYAQDDAAARRLADRLAKAAPADDGSPLRLGALAPDHPDTRYLDGVRRVLEYLRAGDAYQVNLSRRLSAACAPASAVPAALAIAVALAAARPAARPPACTRPTAAATGSPGRRRRRAGIRDRKSVV